tara:strand:- start:887 stop:1942 length:1056 start_codon:yes stop_codon:yes gene_type:complete
MNFKDLFLEHCKKNEFNINQNQIKVVEQLENYNTQNFKKSLLKKIFKKKTNQLGFYLFGGVGVGKTMILDFFYNFVDTKKQRFHFNEFMINFHDFFHEKKGSNDENIINLFVKNLKSKLSLIYFDEFQVTNIVDAMILGKLFEQIFKQNIKVIITSNTKITELYKDGLQRDQFKPFIKIMETKSNEHELIINEDYRKSKENLKQRFFFPINEENNFAINKLFRVLTKNKKNFSKNLNIKGRKFEIKNFYEGISRFHFNELCDKNLGAEDYLEIVKNSKFIVIEKIPQFNDINSDQQQRFITLIDIIYDNNLPIAVTAGHDISKFTSSRSLKEPFKRTVSRIYELTSMKYNL